MGFVFAIIYGAVVAWLVHLAMGREPGYPAVPDIAVGAGAGLVGYWLFGMQLGLHEAGALGSTYILGWLWAGLTSLVASVALAQIGRMRRRA